MPHNNTTNNSGGVGRGITIQGAIEEYLGAKQNSITRKTLDWYTEFLDLFLRFCQDHEPRLIELADITPTIVQQFVGACKPDASPHTRHARAQIVKGFLNWCAKDEDMGVRAKMVSRIEMPKLIASDIELFTETDIARLLRAADRMDQPYRNRALIHILLDTGVRASECCFDAERPSEETGLRLDNLYLARGSESYIWVMGKGLKPRTIGIGHETTMALRRYMNRERGRTDDAGFVFLSRRHGPLSVRMLEQLLTDMGDMAGVPNTHPHRFRHTFAVNQLLAGTSDLVLMRLMGHTSLDSTKIYTRAMSQVQARRSAISVVDRMKHPKK